MMQRLISKPARVVLQGTRSFKLGTNGLDVFNKKPTGFRKIHVSDRVTGLIMVATCTFTFLFLKKVNDSDFFVGSDSSSQHPYFKQDSRRVYREDEDLKYGRN
jgi:hypothetical protein